MKTKVKVSVTKSETTKKAASKRRKIAKIDGSLSRHGVYTGY